MATQPATTQHPPCIPDSSLESKSELALMIEEAQQILADFKRMNQRLDELLAEVETLCVPKGEA